MPEVNPEASTAEDALHRNGARCPVVAAVFCNLMVLRLIPLRRLVVPPLIVVQFHNPQRESTQAIRGKLVEETEGSSRLCRHIHEHSPKYT